MSDSNATEQKKQYSIVRYSRIRDMTTLRHVSNHNTRAVVSENVQRDGPAPVELLADGDPDITVAARRRAKELGLDLRAALCDGKVIAVEAFMGASPEFFERATPDEVEDWYRSSTAFMHCRFGPALISVMKHEDEKTPHLQAVALAAVEKKVGVKGRPPKDPERRRLYDEKVAAMPVHWTFSYNDLLGGAAARLSLEQDDYHACVRHLGLARGERQKEVTDLVLDNGVVVAAARVSRGKRKDGTDRPARHFTTQEYQAETRSDRARSAQQQRETEAALARAREYEQAAEADRAAAAEARAGAEAGQAEVVATSADLARRAAAMADAETGLARRIGAADGRETALAAQEREIAAARLKAAQEEAAATATRAEAERLTDERRRAEASARIARDLAIRDAEAAKEERAKAERAREAVAAQQAAIDERQRQAERDRALEAEQLALLARAADDDEKLGLQEMGSSFWMNDQAMSVGEQAAYDRHWPAPLIAMARHLARALETVREIARRLVAREQRVAAGEAALATREQDAARRLAVREENVAAGEAAHAAREQHAAQRLAERERDQQRRQEAWLAKVDARDRALASDEARVRQEAADATALVVAAEQAKTTAEATLDGVERWTRVLDTLVRFPGVVEYDGTGAITLDHDDRQRLPGWFVATVDTTPPAWASAAIAARHRADAATEQAQRRERVATDAVVELDELIARAGPIMTSAQEAFVVEARRTTAPWMVIGQHGNSRGG